MKRIMAMILSLVMITMAGCSGQNQNVQNVQQNNTTQNVTEAKALNILAATLKGPTGISMIKMIDAVPTLGEGVNVKYEVLSSPEELTAKLVAKQIDFATVPTNQAALLYNKTQDYLLAATTIWGVMYIVSNGDDVTKVSDLKGKTISLSGKGTTPDIALRYILAVNKIDPDKDVTLEYITEHTEVAAKLISGLVKHALLPEPFVTSVLTKKPSAKVTIDLQKEWAKASGDSEFPQTCLVVRGEFAKSNPQVVEKFLDEYKKSIEWANANTVEAGKLVEKNKLGLDVAAVQKAIPRCNIKYVSATDSQKAVDNFLGVILKSQPKSIGGKLPDEKFYYKK